MNAYVVVAKSPPDAAATCGATAIGASDGHTLPETFTEHSSPSLRASAIVLQRFCRRASAKQFYNSRKNWALLRNACRPVMKERVKHLREVYEKHGLVNKEDWSTLIDLEHDATGHLKISYSMQRLLMFIVPLVVVACWQFIPIASYENKWENKHYGHFLVYYYMWLVSCCIFFLPLYSTVIEISSKTTLILSVLFPTIVVGLHSFVFLVRGNTAFWGSCLESSVVHLLISVLGLVLIVGYVVLTVLDKVKRSLWELKKKKNQFLEFAGEEKPFSRRCSLNDLSKADVIPDTVEYEEAIMRHASYSHDILTEAHTFHLLRHVEKRSSFSPAKVAETRKSAIRHAAAMLRFDRHAQMRIEKAARGFTVRKLRQVVWVTITIVWAATFFWCLSLYTAFFATFSHEYGIKLVLTGVFHLMTKLFEVTCLALAEKADVIQLQTYAPGRAVQALRANRKYDNYSLWRLSHRMSFALVAYKRSFYVMLFAEATDLTSFLYMALASLVTTVVIQAFVTSRNFHEFISRYFKRRTFESMACEFHLNNLIDISTTALFYALFFFFFIAAKFTDNRHVYPYVSYASKSWDTVVFLGLYSVFTILGCIATYFHHQQIYPEVQESRSRRVQLLFSVEDKKLFVSVITIFIHIGMDPYYSLAINNMSQVLPCSGDRSNSSDVVLNSTLLK